MNTLLLTNKNKQQILRAMINVLSNDGLIISPSDTVYGAIVDATHNKAVKKLIAFKNRPIGKPVSIFVTDLAMLKENIVVENNQILHSFLPGPFTLIFKSKHNVCQLLESEKGTLGVRIPDYSLINELVKEYGKPVTATSANLSGRPPHFRISTLLKELPNSKKELIDLIVDYGQLPHNKPSTVVDLTAPEIKVLRRGDIIFNQQKNYQTSSSSQTQKVGQHLLTKFKSLSINKPLVYIIEGELGVGKTILIKGMGRVLGISNIISPSYVIFYEYGNFYHFDLYNIQDPAEFKYLGIEKMLKPGNTLAFEWGEKSGEIIELLKKKSNVIYITMKYINEKEREITVKI